MAARSALTSGRSVQWRCTPPMPPVAKTRMPAAAHAESVAATVVPPLARCTEAAPRSRVLSLRAVVSWPSRSSCWRLSPTWSTPSSMPTVAGTAPPARTVASSSRLSARFAGSEASHAASPQGQAMGVRGRPWVRTAVSNATTGRPERSASCTSGATVIMEAAAVPVMRQRLRVRTTPPRRFMGIDEGTTPPGKAFGSCARSAGGASATARRLFALADSWRRRCSASR